MRLPGAESGSAFTSAAEATVAFVGPYSSSGNVTTSYCSENIFDSRTARPAADFRPNARPQTAREQSCIADQSPDPGSQHTSLAHCARSTALRSSRCQAAGMASNATAFRF